MEHDSGNYQTNTNQTYQFIKKFGMVKTITREAKAGKLPPSPKKAKRIPKASDRLITKKKPKAFPTIRVLGFKNPYSFEIYEYSITDGKQGFINNYRKWSRGELEVAALTNANFVGMKMHRDNRKTGNVGLNDETGFARMWLIRYPPEKESTSDTRKEGLQVLKDFFMSKLGTDYPPPDINLVDDTSDVTEVLESLFLDEDIEQIVTSSFDKDELDEEFYEKFTVFAKSIYSDREPSEFAKSELGFPSL